MKDICKIVDARAERKFGFWAYTGEFQREYIRDKLLHLGRKRGRRDADQALTDVYLLPGLIDRRDRRKRYLVEQSVRTGCAVRFDQNVESRSRRTRGARGWEREGDLEVDLDQHRGAADAHGGNRGVDFHVAMFCGLAGDERD